MFSLRKFYLYDEVLRDINTTEGERLVHEANVGLPPVVKRFIFLLFPLEKPTEKFLI